jgi:ABC-2 type transport system permease protein
MGWFLTFVIPVLLVVNVPARVMVKTLDDLWIIGITVVATAALLWGSRKFFRYALRLYRSASS